MIEMSILGGIGFYFIAAAYLDGLYRERAAMLARTRRRYPDIYFFGDFIPGNRERKVKEKEKVDWQHEGF